MIQVAEIRSAYTRHFTQFSKTLAKCSSDALAGHAKNMKLPQNASVEDVVRDAADCSATMQHSLNMDIWIRAHAFRAAGAQV
jgi:hypothetical protein